jgi:ubiquitin C-terminal hydrolase
MYIAAGRSSFLKDELVACSLKEALNKFEKHPKKDVEEAWKTANKGRKVAVKKKPTKAATDEKK